jgi:hypothetical protein
MELVIDSNDPEVMGRSKDRLIDITWWSKVAKQPPESIIVTQNTDGTFYSVSIQFPSQKAISEFKYALSKL